MNAALLATALTLAQPAASPPDFRILPTPADAVALALADAKHIAPGDVPFIRYVFVANATTDKDGWESVQAAVLVLNYISRASVLYGLPPPGTHPLSPLPPVYPVAGGQLVRVDLRRFAPRDADLQQFIDTWEQLQFDPSFARLITRDQLDILAKDRGRALAFFGGDSIPTIRRKTTVTDSIIQVPRYWDDGDKKWYTTKWTYKDVVKDVSVLDVRDVDVIRLNGRTVGPALAALQELTGSIAPVVELEYFLSRATSAIRGKGVFKTVMGGLYPDFIGLRRSKEKGVTDEDLLLQDLIVGGTAKIKAADVFERQRSDRRAAIFRSDVTGSPRLLEWFPITTRADGLSLVFVTSDPAKDDLDIGSDPIRNLVKFRATAREWIWVGANGLPKFALTSAVNGNLQEKAPDNVVRDRFTSPSPYSTELDGGCRSCLGCHGPSDNYQSFKNDVQTLLRSGLNVFGDVTEANKEIRDTLDRLGGQYQADEQRINRTLRQVRDDHAESVLRTTGTWKRSAKGGQTDVAKLGAERITALYASYNYTPIDAKRALRELGIDVAEKDARAALEYFLPKLPTLEDVAVGGVRAGLRVERSTWTFAVEGAAVRVEAALRQLGRKK